MIFTMDNRRRAGMFSNLRYQSPESGAAPTNGTYLPYSLHWTRYAVCLIFVLASQFLTLIFKRNSLQKFCYYATILYTIFAIMRSPYMRSHFDHLFWVKIFSGRPISLRGERTFMTTYLTTYGAKIEKLGREKVTRNKSNLRKPAPKWRINYV